MQINIEKYKDYLYWQMPAYNFFHSNLDGWSIVNEKKYYSYLPCVILKFEKDQLYAYQPRQEFLKPGQDQIKELLAGNEDFKNECEKVYQILKNEAKNLLNLLNSNQINQITKDWAKIYKMHCEAAQLFFSFDFAMTDWIEDIQKNDNELYEQFMIASQPIGLSFVQEEENDLFEIRQKYNIQSQDDIFELNNNQSFKEDLKKHLHKYYWISNSYSGPANLTEEYFIKKILEVKKFELKQNETFKLDKKYEVLAKAISIVANLRDERKKLMLLLIEYMEIYLKEICEKYNYDYNEMIWYSYDEVEKIIKGKMQIKNYSAKQTRIGLLENGKLVDVSEEDFNQVKNLYDQQGQGLEEIKGVIANKGKVKDNIRIIKEIKDIEVIKEGEILVTSMTRPEFVPAMKKAAAIITNEGGITCHAAIVSREMDKPCIIGTKVATQVLKNGMEVEVDADNGVVKIL